MNKMASLTLDHYLSIIQGYCPDDIGIELEKIGAKTFEAHWSLKQLDLSLLDQEEILEAVKPALTEILEKGSKAYNKPLWIKINVQDQAHNEYRGIGYFNFNEGWLDFVLRYLNYDRAEQSGDTLFVIFDVDFEWALYFEFSQDNQELKIEIWEKEKAVHNKK